MNMLRDFNVLKFKVRCIGIMQYIIITIIRIITIIIIIIIREQKQWQ